MAEELSQRDMLTGLLDGIERYSPSLGAEARDVVNQGTDREEIFVDDDIRQGRRKEYTFRKHSPLTPEEAIGRLLELLTSRLVELPMAINSVKQELEQCFQRSTSAESRPSERRVKLTVALELGGAGDLFREESQKTMDFPSFDPVEIAELRSKIDALRQLLGRRSDHGNQG